MEGRLMSTTSQYGKLAGKVALVTGGASGIGAGICREFAREGATVVVADIQSERAQAFAKELGEPATAVSLDVCEAAQVAAVHTEVVRELGGTDILVHCAGLNIFHVPEAYSEAEWQRIRSITLDGAWHMCRAFMTEMMAKRAGKILTIGSAAAILGIPKAAPYTAAKHGLVGLTRALAIDLAKHNINVNCICPATVDTPLARQATQPIFLEEMQKSIPLGRLGTVEDMAKAALFLCSSDSDWITGVVLPVDGGLTCCIRAHHYE